MALMDLGSHLSAFKEDMVAVACNTIGVDNPQIMEQAFDLVFEEATNGGFITEEMVATNIEQLIDAYNQGEAKIFQSMCQHYMPDNDSKVHEEHKIAEANMV